MNSKLRVILSLLILSCLLVVVSIPILAAPANPDSIDLYTARVFQNIFETDDMLFVVSYDVAYASEPTELASETFQLALYDEDGSMLLFSRMLNYYQYNIHSIYLDADLAGGLVWGSEYKVRVMGNPIYFSPVEDTTMDTITLSESTHWLSGTMSTSRTLLQYYCLDLAAILEDQWAITLVVTTADGQVLNALGRIAFLDAIPTLDSAIPELFQVGSSTLTEPVGEYVGTYEEATTVSAKLGAAIAASFSGLAEALGISAQGIAMLWIMFIALTIASIVFLSTGNTTASLILVIPVVIVGAFVGAIPLALLFVLLILVVIYMMYHIWLRGM